MFFTEVAPLIVFCLSTITILSGGAYLLFPKLWWKKRTSKIERARQKRLEVYDAAEAARKRLVETKHKAREEVAAIWVRQWMDAGAPVHELNSSFQKWEDEPYYATTQLTDHKVRWQAIGTIYSPIYGEGHRLAVGEKPEYMSHNNSCCPKCATAEADRKKRADALQGGYVQDYGQDYGHFQYSEITSETIQLSDPSWTTR